FSRALRDAIRFWPSIVLAMLCSLAVAALWSANIGAFYPILEVVFRGESLQNWVEREIGESEASVARLERDLADYAARGVPEAAADALVARQKLDSERRRLERYRHVRPYVARFIPHSPFQTISLIVAVLMASTLIKHAFLIANELLVGRVALDISRNIRMKVFDKALRMDRATFSRYGHSGFTAQITHTAEMLSLGLTNFLGGAIREPLKIVSCLVGAGIICWRLLLLSVVVAPVVILVIAWLTRRLKAISQRILNRAAGFHEVMHEALGNIQTVQAYTMEDTERHRFMHATKDMRNFGLRFILYTALTKPVIEFLGLGMMCVAIVGGAFMVLNQETHILGIPISSEPLTVTDILIFFAMLVGISDPLRKLSAVYSSIQAGSMAADMLYPLLDTPIPIQDPPVPATVGKPHRCLQLEHVTFAYHPDHVVLRDVSLRIPFGRSIALIGPNGCGKSTLIQLLCRFYQPLEGRLTLDGVDIQQLRVADLRGRIALVTQHTELFNETVEYNIRYGFPEATFEQVVAAAEDAHAHEFISTVLSDGYRTNVGTGGHRLSGGQRQRIALARALLRDPEILILDEASSQIDMQSEQLICESLARHRGRRTNIIITHREAMLALADEVYRVENGSLQRVDVHQTRAA
ncbi:MAG: ABC transporter ATP-binding protein, partial [Planctomycetes bacterium]|nr:ABC transporter ATP-binding protein [Planctomycetota bacterium]